MDRFGMLEPITEFAAQGKPVFGTCAGAILLAKEIEDSGQIRLGLMNIRVKRNAYGRQIESFEADIPFPILGEIPVRGVFIRAPIITNVETGTKILSTYGGNPVFVQENNLLACTFHPELTEDLRIHEYFIDLIAGA
jgi:5'-phosphate synthase pdxT subunit